MLSRAPKARTCYICGRPTLLPGYDIHVAKCREIFEQREAQKPAKERRPCPRDPYASMGGRGGRSLEEENEIIQQQWKSNLAQCENCGRSFLPEKLPVHQRSCTASNPAKRVSGSLRPEPADTWDGSTDRSSTTGYQESSMAFSGKRGGAVASFRGSSFVDDDRAVGGPQQSFGRSGKTLGGLDQYRDTPEYGHLIKCRECGRNFNPESYDKHAKICRKVFKTKRKPYDSAKHRVMGTELAAYYDGRGRTKNSVRASTLSSTAAASSSMSGSAMYASQSTGGGGSRRSRAAAGGSKWRQQSSAFREAIRQAKLVSLAEQKSKATGIPLHALLPANTGRGGGGSGRYEVDSSYIQCPHCGRSFNQKAGERHIPQCQNIIHKPSRLARHSGAPSYSTNTPGMTSSARVSSGGGGFGMSTRASALNNRAISRWSDAGGSDSGSMHELQMMAGSKTHHMSDPVRFNSNVPTSSSGRGYASLGGGPSNANNNSLTVRRRSFGSTPTGGSSGSGGGGGYGYDMTGGMSMRAGGDARSSSRPRGRFG